MNTAFLFDPQNAIRWNRADGLLLNLRATLKSGQAFRWRKDAAGIWRGTVGDTAVFLHQTEGDPTAPLHWQTFPEADNWNLVSDYLRLAVPLETLYAEWSANEPRIAPALASFRGMRVLRQPPIECFFAFQCAACNTVTKIERSVFALAGRYGANATGISAFPTLDALANADETFLRADLWGYRAPRVVALAREMRDNRPAGWLESLREVPYPEAKSALVQLYGVGAKLADCVCLFSLDKDAAVPVDTHVRQIAHRLFLPEMAGSSLTPRVYEAISAVYRERFGAYAGWAQQYLFFGELGR